MTQTIINIGNSQGIILPKEILKSSQLKVGDKVIVEEKENKVTISPVRKLSAKGVDARFMKMVDEFIEDHKDVLEALANR